LGTNRAAFAYIIAVAQRFAKLQFSRLQSGHKKNDQEGKPPVYPEKEKDRN
jgi:hypothetical protein